jgi:acetyl esterase/lipase
VSGWFLLVSAIGAWFTFNAFVPMRRSLPLLPSFLAAWLTGELAPHHLVWQAVATAYFVWRGALDHWTGVLALALTVGSWAGLVVLIARSFAAASTTEAALRDGLGHDYLRHIAPDRAARYDQRLPWRQLAMPFRIRFRDVARVRGVTFATVGRRHLDLDVLRPRGDVHGAPCLLYVHGGGWVLGLKDRQGLPFLTHLASRGWVCFVPDYRLSPRATFPDHLIDVKRALHWVREHAAEFGGDPRFVAVSGNSAGGHLSSLLALTANDPEYQPGFEDADTNVEACVPYYGVYDFTNRAGTGAGRDLIRFLERVVMKTSFKRDREAFSKASPIDRVHVGAPPFFVIHGSLDNLASVGDARLLVDALRAVSSQPVAYAELPAAQHAFDGFPSIRTVFVVRAVERFLDWVYTRWRAESAPAGMASGVGPDVVSGQREDRGDTVADGDRATEDDGLRGREALDLGRGHAGQRGRSG